MPVEKREYEIETGSLQGLRLRTRPADGKDLNRVEPMSADQEVSQITPSLKIFSRETIYRLIDWMKDG